MLCCRGKLSVHWISGCFNISETGPGKAVEEGDSPASRRPEGSPHSAFAPQTTIPTQPQAWAFESELWAPAEPNTSLPPIRQGPHNLLMTVAWLLPRRKLCKLEARVRTVRVKSCQATVVRPSLACHQRSQGENQVRSRHAVSPRHSSQSPFSWHMLPSVRA